MDENNTTTGNTGEWSELYTLGFLLVNGGAYAADERQNRNEEIFYQVLKIIFDGKEVKRNQTMSIPQQSRVTEKVKTVQLRRNSLENNQRFRTEVMI